MIFCELIAWLALNENSKLNLNLLKDSLQQYYLYSIKANKTCIIVQNKDLTIVSILISIFLFLPK